MFKVGDIVVSTADKSVYGITCKGWVGKVVKVYPEDQVDIRVQYVTVLPEYSLLGDKVAEGSFNVQSKYFSLYRMEKTKKSPYYVGKFSKAVF